MTVHTTQEHVSWVCGNPDCKAKNMIYYEKLMKAIEEMVDAKLICSNCGYAQRVDYRLLENAMASKHIISNQCIKHIVSDLCIPTLRIHLCITSSFQKIKISPYDPEICSNEEKIKREDFIRKYGYDPVIRSKFLEKNFRQRCFKNFKHVKK